MNRVEIVDKLRGQLRMMRRSLKTERAYVRWVQKYIAFLGSLPADMSSEDKFERYMTYLAVKCYVSASTQNQAFNALLFLYRHVLKIDIEKVQGKRAKRDKCIPSVMTQEEAGTVINNMQGTNKLIASLLYGCGLRLMEALRLRVKDIDFGQMSITLRNTKGHADRVVMLPESLFDKLKKQVEKAERTHIEDIANGYGFVEVPHSLAKKYPSDSHSVAWQFVFQGVGISTCPRTGEMRRHHLHETNIQRAVKRAVNKVNLKKKVSCHTFRHSFATHLIEAGYDIRTVQELLGHKSVETTMIYTHVAKKAKLSVKSPIDSILQVPLAVTYNSDLRVLVGGKK